jgi:hypothetical protein
MRWHSHLELSVIPRRPKRQRRFRCSSNSGVSSNVLTQSHNKIVQQRDERLLCKGYHLEKGYRKEDQLKMYLLGLVVQVVRKLLAVVGGSWVYPVDEVQGRRSRSMASESSQETRNARWRHGPSDAVEMGCRIADSVPRMQRTSVCVRESDSGTLRQSQRLAAPPIEHHQRLPPPQRLRHYKDPQGVEGTARCSRCTLQPAGPNGRLQKKSLRMRRSLRTDFLLEHLVDHSRS